MYCHLFTKDVQNGASAFEESIPIELVVIFFLMAEQVKPCKIYHRMGINRAHLYS